MKSEGAVLLRVLTLIGALGQLQAQARSYPPVPANRAAPAPAPAPKRRKVSRRDNYSDESSEEEEEEEEPKKGRGSGRSSQKASSPSCDPVMVCRALQHRNMSDGRSVLSEAYRM